MRIAMLLVALVNLNACSWPHVAMTYGSRYGFNVSNAVYAEIDGLRIVDRPDLHSIHIAAPNGSPALTDADVNGTYKDAVLKYLSLDRNCEITGSEVMMLISVEYLYKCAG